MRWLLGSVLILAACGDPAVTTTIAETGEFPTVVVRGWLDAVAHADLAGIESAVDGGGAAVLIAAENGFTPEELAVMLDTGIGETVAGSYWRSFAGSFEEFRGVPIDALVVGDFRSVSGAAEDYAAVAVIGEEGATDVITRRDDQGQWRVDLIATVGSPLVQRFRRLLEATPEDAAGNIVREHYRDTVLPALRIATAGAEDPVVIIEVEAIEEMLES